MANCPVCNHEIENEALGCPQHGATRTQQLFHAPPSEAGSLVGATIRGLYQVEEIIGKGAMGTVYRAFNLKTKNNVAIKVLHTHLTADPESIKRFQHEAKAASTLMHAHIVRIFDVGVAEGGQPYIVMELLDGVTLSDFLKQRKHLDTREALPLMRQACEALAEAHSHGVLHRDIKPANIMLCTRFGSDNFVLVLDFSIAKIIQKVSDVDSTTPGLIFGSPTYMSPERYMGKGGDFRSDIYSMGIIMFQMLAGRAPFKSSDLYKLMNEHISSAPPRVRDLKPDSDVPDLLEKIIAKALAKRPEDRQENMKQLLAEVNEVYNVLQNNTISGVTTPDMLAQESYRQDEYFNHLQMQQLANDGIRTPENSFAAYAGSITPKEKQPQGFEINPSVRPGMNSSGTLPAVTLGAQKSPPPEESIKQKVSEFGNSGRWDKSLINKSGTRPALISEPPAPRQRIRPAEEKGRIPLKIVALLAAVLFFVLVLLPQLMPGKKVNNAGQHGQSR